MSSSLGPQCSFRVWQAFKNKCLSTCYSQALFWYWGYTREEIQIEYGENGLSLTFEILVCVLFFSLHWLFLIMGIVFLIMGIILDILSHCDE